MAGVICMTSYILLREPTEHEIANRLRKAGKPKMLEVCSNEITGIIRVVSLEFDDVGVFVYPVHAMDNPANWSGKAVIEYVNEKGGIGRTNLFFRFERYDSAGTGKTTLSCWITSRPVKSNWLY